MRTYLDNNATTEIHPAVAERLAAAFRDLPGNASSIHADGRSARRALEEARESVASLLRADAREVIFTSGGTESNNAAIHGAILSGSSRCHIVTTTIEHPSVLEPLRELERHGYEVTWIKPESSGRVSTSSILQAIRPDTRLVTLMLANNETGVLQPAADVGRVCRQRGIHFHCDAVQAGGKLPLDAGELCADTISIAAHKMYGPKGIGALYVRRGTVLVPLMLGGAQERRRRPGTEPVALAVGFAEACRIAEDGLEQRSSSIGSLRDEFERTITRSLPEAVVNGGEAPRLSNTSNLRFDGCDGETLVIGLDLEGVSASAGSACSSGRMEASHVLLEMGLTEEQARSSVRFSLGRGTSRDELNRVSEILVHLVPRTRRGEIARLP